MQDHDLGRKFLDAVSAREGVEKLGGMSETSAEGTTHSVLVEEQVAFANWINRSINTMQPLPSITNTTTRNSSSSSSSSSSILVSN